MVRELTAGHVVRSSVGVTALYAVARRGDATSDPTIRVPNTDLLGVGEGGERGHKLR